MKHLSCLIGIIILSGCQTMPTVPAFPEMPAGLSEPCEKLEKISEDKLKLSEFLIVVSKNYTRYHECSGKVDSLLEWYNSQKKIQESLSNGQ